jgi:hypothetical protein
MRRPNHASRFEGIAKTNLQASRASDTETLQSQVNKAAKKRLSLSELEILHGRRTTRPGAGFAGNAYSLDLRRQQLPPENETADRRDPAYSGENYRKNGKRTWKQAEGNHEGK